MSTTAHGQVIDSFGLDHKKLISSSRFTAILLFVGILAPGMYKRPETIPAMLIFAGICWALFYFVTRWYARRAQVEIYSNGLRVGQFISWDEISNVESVGKPGLNETALAHGSLKLVARTGSVSSLPAFS